MRKHISIGVAALVLIGAAGAAEYEQARAGRQKALTFARQWQADARLTGVGSPGVEPNGTSRLWQYDFFSGKTGKCLRVQVAAGGAAEKAYDNDCPRPTPIDPEFVDSAVALAEATRAGMKHGDVMTMSVRHVVDRALRPARTCWMVSSEHDFDATRAVMRARCIDPKTGKFVLQLAGER
jgi:hypothetical protein